MNPASISPETAIEKKVGAILQDWNAVDPKAAAQFLSGIQIIPQGQRANFQAPLGGPGG